MDIRPGMVLIAATLLAAPALAANDTRQISAAGAWEGYVFTEGGSKVCYAAARADRTQGDQGKRAGTAMAVTHRGKSQNEVSVIGSFGFRKDSDVEIQVGAMKHSLFARGDSAWAKDASADKAIVAAMAKGREVVVKSIPAKGTGPYVDTVPLRGFAEALAAIDKACGVKR